jgi:ribonuclease VapC
VIVVDSSALIAIPRREPEADGFLQIIVEAESCLLSSVSLLETSMVLVERTGDATSWREFDALVARAGIGVVALDAELTEVARAAFLRYGEAAIPPPSISATAHPMPSPNTTICRSCSRVPTFREPIFGGWPDTTSVQTSPRPQVGWGGLPEPPPHWWTALLSSRRSGKVLNEPGASSIYG